jgi:undecaprenol kinase
MKNAALHIRLRQALSGIVASLRCENSFRTHAIGLVFVIVVLLATRPAPIWWATLLLTSGCVLAIELINTALEKLIDHLHPDQHPSLKIVKDTLAGAVLVMSVIALVVFGAFLWTRTGP